MEICHCETKMQHNYTLCYLCVNWVTRNDELVINHDAHVLFTHRFVDQELVANYVLYAILVNTLW